MADGEPARAGLPSRCDSSWFADSFCGGADLSSVQPRDYIWKHVTTLLPHDLIALLACCPAVRGHMFEPEMLNVNGDMMGWDGVGYGMGWNGMGWDMMGWDGMGWDRI